jgi:DNA repair protein RecN (Recombination protein N)
MLRQLSVQNFAIVDRVDLEFEPGFNVLTGETGAGKSLLVDALHFLLGERLDPSVLRAGEEKASAEALFQVRPGSPAIAKLAEWGLDVVDGEILLRREYTRSSGKTRSTGDRAVGGRRPVEGR